MRPLCGPGKALAAADPASAADAERRNSRSPAPRGDEGKSGRLWVWDPYDGRRVERAAQYRAFAPLGATRMLAAQIGGLADVIDLDGARFSLAVRRTICLLADGDCSSRPRWDLTRGRLKRLPKLELAAASDGREVAVLEWPELDLSGNGGSRKGRLAVLSPDPVSPPMT